MEKVTLPVFGMSCASCAGKLERHLAGVAGVRQAGVNLATAQATVEGGLTIPQLMAAVQDAGFRVPTVTVTLPVQGMAGEACAQRVATALQGIDGVLSVQVNLAAGEATVNYVPEAVTFEMLQKSVQQAGYDLSPVASDDTDVAEVERQREYRSLRTRLLWGAVLTGLTMVVMHWDMMLKDHTHHLGQQVNFFLQWLLVTPVQFWVGWGFHRGTWLSARHGTANMNTLVTVGTFSAYLYSLAVMLFPSFFQQAKGVVLDVYFETAASIIVLILLGRFLEARAKGRTSQAIRRLMGLQPRTARVIRKGKEVDIPIALVAVGDQVVVRPGEKVPVDGVIQEGESSLDESLMTGESMPVTRRAGESVVGGSINLEGGFVMTASRVGRETVLARIVHLVRQAQGAKPAIARLADQIAAWFVPAVMAIATVTFLVWWLWGPQPSLTYALLNFVAVLIIACPCALGLATPTSILVGIGKGAEHGILIRGGDALETAHKLSVVVFDKTGTVTKGKPEVTNWLGEDAALALAASAEKRSEHPLAQAVVQYAQGLGLPVVEPETFRSVTGRGVEARVDGRRVLVGSSRFLAENQVTVENRQQVEALEEEGKTVMLVAVDGLLQGMIAVADAIRPESRQAVTTLQSMGLQVVLLTGDNQRTAQAIARQLGIEKVIAEATPADKAEQVALLQQEGKKVAMVGDGINDAPALARADVGIAIGRGADVAMEAASITLMTSDPRSVATAIQLSRATMVNIRQNLFWAFAYNVILIPLAAGVWYPWFHILLSPVFAAAAMGLSSVTVVSNALRLRHFQPS
ncbi:MAG: heavy metal translocating P-type ATPase [Magnetococcales bacterium]|nr:heavy metal translocating P-type ATPase [Magnetococcales bacterium]NGZ26493.1 heavy metal translocating P-type ATPase [Magnetococcales bacterium]